MIFKRYITCFYGHFVFIYEPFEWDSMVFGLIKPRSYLYLQLIAFNLPLFVSILLKLIKRISNIFALLVVGIMTN